MAKIRLLQAVCAVAVLAAVSALAQKTDAAPAAGPGTSMPGETQTMHRTAMARHMDMMHGKTDSSQDAAVDRLNDQSFQAASKGQAFVATPGSAPAPMSMPAAKSMPGMNPPASTK